GFSTQDRDADGNYMLHLIAQQNNTELFNQLFEGEWGDKIADQFFQKNYQHQTPIECAAIHGNADILYSFSKVDLSIPNPSIDRHDRFGLNAAIEIALSSSNGATLTSLYRISPNHFSDRFAQQHPTASDEMLALIEDLKTSSHPTRRHKLFSIFRHRPEETKTPERLNRKMFK
ncbi:MAG: hypothetical protein ACE365_08030, partial [Gammaproteobacteria bacterium]